MRRNRSIITIVLIMALALMNPCVCFSAPAAGADTDSIFASKGAEASPGAEASISSSMNDISTVTQMGDVMGIIAVKEKADIRGYFDSYLDISRYKVDSADKKIASVTKYGTVKGKKAGIAVIRAYNSAGTEIANRRIEVQKPVLTLPYISDLSTSCNAREYFGNSTTMEPDSYKSSNEKVAVIDNKTGVIHPKKKGRTRITAYFGEGSNAARVSCILCINTGKPAMHDYYVDLGNGERKKVRGYFDIGMARKLYSFVNDYRLQYKNYDESKAVIPFAGSYDEDSLSQNALNAIAENRALESAVLFSHIRPKETSYYTAYNEDSLINRDNESVVIKNSLTGTYAGEDLIGGNKYDSAVYAFSALKSYNTSLMSNAWFDGMGVAVFVTENKTKMSNGTKQKLKYYIVFDYIGPKKPKETVMGLAALSEKQEPDISETGTGIFTSEPEQEPLHG